MEVEQEKVGFEKQLDPCVYLKAFELTREKYCVLNGRIDNILNCKNGMKCPKRQIRIKVKW